MKLIFILLFLFSAFASAAPVTIEEQLADAELTYANRNFQKAVEKFEPLLKHFQESGDQQKVADITYKIGRSNRRLGNFAEALKLLDRAMTLHTAIADKKGLGLDLTEIAIANQRQGNYDDAILWANKAMPIHKEIQNLIGISKTEDVLGQVYYRRGEYESAREHGERAVSAAKESEDKETLDVAYTNLGQIYYAEGEHSRALEAYTQAQTLAEQINDRNGIATNLANAALVHWDQGNLEQALVVLKRAGAIFREVGNRSLEANNFFNVGNIQHELGNYTSALEALRKSLSMANDMKDQGLAAAALESIGDLEREIGDYDSALTYLQKSLSLSQEIGEKASVTNAIATIGKIKSNQGNDRAALEYYEKALLLARESGLQRLIHQHLRNLGIQYAKMGNFPLALERLKEAIDLEDKSKQMADMGWTLSVMGAVYRKTGDLAAADAALDRAIELLQEAGTSNPLWSALYNKGLVRRDQSKFEESQQWMKKAVDVIERIRERVSLPEQRSTFLSSRLDVYEDLIAILVKTQSVSEAYEYAQRSKSRSFLDLVSEGRIEPHAGMDPGQFNEKRRMLAKLIRLNQQIKEEQEKEKPDAALIVRLEQARNNTDQEYTKLLSELRENNPRFAEIQKPRLFSLAEAQTILDEESVLLDYFVGKKGSILFAITPKGSQLFHLPAEQKLNQEVHELLEMLQKPEPVWQTTDSAYSRYAKLAHLLYQQILNSSEPIWKNKKRIIIAADGPLNYLPFETLLAAKINPEKIDFSLLPYFGASHEIQYIPSISSFAAILQTADVDHKKPEHDFIAFADPLGKEAKTKTGFGSGITRDWSMSLSELPYARAEVDAISKLYPKDRTSVLVGKDASEAKAKAMHLDAFGTLHFATHGLIDEERPQLSSIVLNAGNSEEDGYLTMREIFDLKLDADLVVLSACKTGLGKQIRGEGVSSLARAFFCAGASSVVVSLWNVSDQSTADFMTDFYRAHVQQGMTKTAALKEARLKMIRSKKYSHPYYWSSFILIGAR